MTELPSPERHPAAEHLCGVRLTLRGRVRWVACDGSRRAAGDWVEVDFGGPGHVAMVVVGCGQLIENEASVVPEGRVLRTAPGQTEGPPFTFNSSLFTRPAGVPSSLASGDEAASFLATVAGDGAGGAPTAADVIAALFPRLDEIDPRARSGFARNPPRDQEARQGQDDRNDSKDAGR